MTLMKISDYLKELQQVARGVADPLQTIYGVTAYRVHKMHLSDDTDVELHYQDGTLVAGYINMGEKTFALDDDELVMANEAYRRYNKADNIRKLEALK